MYNFFTLLVYLIILISSEGFWRWSRFTFLPKLATKEIRHVNKSLYIFKLTNKLGKIVWFVLFFQLHIKSQERLCRSRIMKRFNIFYGGTKVKGNRDASFRRAVNTEGARGDSCPPPKFWTHQPGWGEQIVPTTLLLACRPRIFRPSSGPAVLLQNQCVATACRNRISMANPILAPVLLAFFVPIEMPGTVQWNLGQTPFLKIKVATM